MTPGSATQAIQPERRRGQDAAPHRTNDLDRAEHRHTITSGGTPLQGIGATGSLQASSRLSAGLRSGAEATRVPASAGAPFGHARNFHPDPSGSGGNWARWSAGRSEVTVSDALVTHLCEVMVALAYSVRE